MGANIDKWDWNFGDGGMSEIQHPQHCYNTQGKYSITLTVRSSNGCSASLTNINLISLDPPPVALFSAPLSSSILEPDISFTDNSIGANSWNWNFNDVSDSVNNNSDLPNPSHLYSKAGTYCVTLAVSNSAGCVDTNQKCFEIIPEFYFYIPNSFSPNGDGINDDFYCKSENCSQFEMTIYNRWGHLIFSTKDINEHWNGRVNKTANLSQEDVYIYVVIITDNNNESYKYTGNVNIIR